MKKGKSFEHICVSGAMADFPSMKGGNFESRMKDVPFDQERTWVFGTLTHCADTKTTYFGETFARVGAHLRGLIIPIISDRIVSVSCFLNPLYDHSKMFRIRN
ncbi:unnamed protein product [Allacma fusca]|uniref:Uncharacterized protein n=1 Tax=Allacma fusca TaxID=39272 RepID=A0A8J2KSW8_9HEXA|nr:unnamed protein product [Allacma fusca]